MSTTMLCETRQGSQSRFRSCSLRSKPMMFLLRDPNVVREDRSTQRCVLRVVWLSSSPKLLTLSQRCSRSTGHSTEALKTTTPSSHLSSRLHSRPPYIQAPRIKKSEKLRIIHPYANLLCVWTFPSFFPSTAYTPSTWYNWQ